MTTLDKKKAFFHVIDDHRWLVASGCAWHLAGANGVGATRQESLQLLPNIDVMIRDCLLLHARSLIKFYRNGGRTEDIRLCDFSIPPIDRSLDSALKDYEHSIEVHLLHLTDWRDSDYRTLHPTGRGATRGRRDWDREAVALVEKLIFGCLKYASEQSGLWQQPFKDLHTASAARYQDKSYVWPTELCEKSDVERYLTALGL
jgi:hypothetical protein